MKAPRRAGLSRDAAGDMVAGLLLLGIGLFFALIGPRYNVGTPARMGPGFLPTALGAVLAVIGLLIAVRPLLGARGDGTAVTLPDVRGALCILLGMIAFIVLGEVAGLLPAIFACVAVAALGDRQATWRGTLALGAGLAVVGTLLFVVVLGIPIPAWRF